MERDNRGYTTEQDANGKTIFYYRQGNNEDAVLDAILEAGQEGDIIHYIGDSQLDNRKYKIKVNNNEKYPGFPDDEDEADYGGGIKLSKRKSGKRKSGKRKSGKRKSGKRKSGKRKSGKRK